MRKNLLDSIYKQTEKYMATNPALNDAPAVLAVSHVTADQCLISLHFFKKIFLLLHNLSHRLFS